MMQQLACGLDVKDAVIEAYNHMEKELLQVQTLCDPESGMLPSGHPFETYVQEQEESFAFSKMLFLLSYGAFFSDIGEIKSGRWKVLLIETPIQITLEGINAPLRCKPDLILITPENELIVVDYKTTGSKISNLVASYRWDFQMLLTGFIVSKYFAEKGYTLKKFLHCVIKKPTIKFPTKNSPTFDDYLVNCKEWYKVQEEKDPNEPTIARSLLAFDAKFDISTEFLNKLKRMDYACSVPTLNPVEFPRESKMCMGRYGNSPCPYLNLCITSPMFWSDFIEKQFTQEFREDSELDLLEKENE
jgi:hypothetical protein